MEKLISFCRTCCNNGKIMLAKGYKNFGKVPVKDLEINPMDKKTIDDFLKKMDLTLYFLNEVNYLYFFYKVDKNLLAVRYSSYYGDITITEDITVTENLEADYNGEICVFVPELSVAVS